MKILKNIVVSLAVFLVVTVMYILFNIPWSNLYVKLSLYRNTETNMCQYFDSNQGSRKEIDFKGAHYVLDSNCKDIYNKVATTTKLLSELSNKQQVEKLLVQKFNQPLYDNEMIIQKENDSYIVGQAGFGEGGILVMASKANGVWTLVYTGNAEVNCDELLEIYNFPPDFLPSYCDCNDKIYKYTDISFEGIRPKYCE